MLEEFVKFAPQAGTAGLFRPGTPRAVLDAAGVSGMSAGAFGSGFSLNTTDAAVSGGLAFLVGELEKRDPTIYEPLTSVTYPRDIPIRVGGGWVDYTSNEFADYGTTGPNTYSMTGTQTTTIPNIQINLTKDLYPTQIWQMIMKINFIDMQKASGIGRNLDTMLDRGVKLNWNKALDQTVYLGPSSGRYGLVNNPAIAATSAAVGSGSSTRWALKNPGEILFDINTLQVNSWAASQYDLSGMINQILIPPAQYAQLASQLISSAGNSNIITYLEKNNIGASQGVELRIFPSRWCVGAGAAGTDRMVGYVNRDDRVQFDITVPIQRVMTTPTIVEGGGAYHTLYAGQFGVVKFLYNFAAGYVDGV